MAESTRHEPKTGKDTEERIQELKKKKAHNQWQIKNYEERIADYQREIDDPHTNEVRRKQLKDLIQNAKNWIQTYKQWIVQCDAELAEIVRGTRYDLNIAQDVDVNYKANKGVIVGNAGTGKSSTMNMMFDEEPPSERISTPCVTAPVRSIALTRIEMHDKRCKKLSNESFTLMMTKTAKEISTPTGIQRIWRSIDKALFYSPPKLSDKDEVEQDLVFSFRKADSSVGSLQDQVVGEMRDCGGQPQFLEILPRFISNLSLGILAMDLSQHLDNHPLIYYYDDKGESVGEGVRSPLSNEQILRRCLQMIASQSQGGKPVRFVFVGTHRDLEHKCSQSREEKNAKLVKLVKSFNLENSIIYKSRNEPIFAINAKTPTEEDYSTARQLGNLFMDKSYAAIVRMPMKFYSLELTIQKMVEESDQVAFHLSDILQRAKHFHFTEDLLTEGLRFLHENKFIFFFEKEFPGVVIGEPQAVFSKHAQVVAHHIKLATNPHYKQQRPLVGKWRKFMKCGILSISGLEEFPDRYTEGVFSPADMMRLFVKLLMVSEVSEGEYLMPCVLPAVPQPNCNPEPETQSVPPMLLHFPGGAPRLGVFCGTICHLMTKNKWKLFECPDSNDPFHITRNSVHFSLPNIRCKVTINDPFDSFFLVTVHVPPDVPSYSKCVSKACVEVRDTLIKAIDRVTEELNYNPDTPEVIFLCEEHKTTSLHPATIDDLGDELLCSQQHVRGGLLTAQHEVWLKGSTSSHAPPPDSTLNLSPPSGAILLQTPPPNSTPSQTAPSGTSSLETPPTSSTSPQTPPQVVSTDLSCYVSSLPAGAHPHLELLLDQDNDFDKDLIEIADFMLNWEELSALLKLTAIDISDIRKKYPFEPSLQRREALMHWKNRYGLQATYGHLLELFVEGGHTECAKATCTVLKKKYDSNVSNIKNIIAKK